jgi:hypothetical protein
MADKRKGWILFTEELGRDPLNAAVATTGPGQTRASASSSA